MKSQEKDKQEVMIQADALEVLVFLLPLFRNWSLNSNLVTDSLQEQCKNSQTAYFSDDRCHHKSKPYTRSRYANYVRIVKLKKQKQTENTKSH